MTKRINKNRNTNDEATLSDAIVLSNTTSTKIANANPNRIFFYVTNNGAADAIWIKLQAASTDNDQKGIFLNEKEKGRTSWQMPSDNIYTGEISAIAVDGNPIVYVTEY